MPRSFYYMKYTGKWNQKALGAAVSFFLIMLLLFSLTRARLSQEALAARLAPDILRFHVLANSGSPEDQALKLEVRQLLLDTIYQDLSEEKGGLPPREGIFSKDALSAYIIRRHAYLEKVAERYMHARGFPYSAKIRLEQCYFPTKQYGDITLPCGSYDAVRVLLGEGRGKNWWCVLYPPLCFSGITASGEVPASSKKELAALLPEEDYQSLTGSRTIIFGDQEICPIQTGESKAGKINTDKSAEAGVPQIHVKFWLAELFYSNSKQE